MSGGGKGLQTLAFKEKLFGKLAFLICIGPLIMMSGPLIYMYYLGLTWIVYALEILYFLLQNGFIKYMGIPLLQILLSYMR